MEDHLCCRWEHVWRTEHNPFDKDSAVWGACVACVVKILALLGNRVEGSRLIYILGLYQGGTEEVLKRFPGDDATMT